MPTIRIRKRALIRNFGDAAGYAPRMDGMRASVIGAAEVFQRLRGSINVGAVQAGARKPFRFLLCGDPALISELRRLLLDGHDADGYVSLDAAATTETIDPGAGRRIDTVDARCVIFLGRAGDR